MSKTIKGIKPGDMITLPISGGENIERRDSCVTNDPTNKCTMIDYFVTGIYPGFIECIRKSDATRDSFTIGDLIIAGVLNNDISA